LDLLHRNSEARYCSQATVLATPAMFPPPVRFGLIKLLLGPCCQGRLPFDCHCPSGLIPFPMLTPALKRRRIDSTSKLTKPFKSPLRASTGSFTEPPQALDRACDSRSAPTRTPSKSSPLPSPLCSEPALRDLQRQHGILLSRLNALTAELDTVIQAQKVEASSKDKELERLIGLWKGVCRAAAEELFRGARDRVNRMGGVRAWKESERNRTSAGWAIGWDRGDPASADAGIRDMASEDTGDIHAETAYELVTAVEERLRSVKNADYDGVGSSCFTPGPASLSMLRFVTGLYNGSDAKQLKHPSRHHWL
jgi:Swi5-dependent recombination DNA repair protein 1